MNTCEYEVLSILKKKGYINQRVLAEESGYSVGAVNNAIKKLTSNGFIDSGCNLTEKAEAEFCRKAPKNAIILAAGYGMRMVPINVETPKAFVEVHGEALIERQIKQLNAVGITDIYVVVGFMKEQFDYLIDKYGVKLIVNTEYSTKNNLHSLRLAEKYIGNSYIVPCDIWCEENPFSRNELYSWYMLSDRKVKESHVRVNRKNEPVAISQEEEGNAMIGISYLSEEDAESVKSELLRLDGDDKYNDSFWEETLFSEARMTVKAKIVSAEKVTEINTYEQLREFDSDSRQLETKTITVAANALQVESADIKNIEVLKKGMTNRSFIFECKGSRYIMRIPGEGTDMLINRKEEALVYNTLKGKNICEDVLYINPENGYKITKFFENARVCDPENKQDVADCMKFLRGFHNEKMSVSHVFDIFAKIDFYESLWNGQKSAYRDYEETKEKVFSLRNYIESSAEPYCLTHIDAVPDNFLFFKDQNGEEKIRLIDWEYSAMQDPHVDIAMFAIYAMYDEKQTDDLIDAYFEGNCSKAARKKIYSYISACGLLWSNWCEYKRQLGVEFGEYSLAQYRYAKLYYKKSNDILV